MLLLGLSLQLTYDGREQARVRLNNTGENNTDISGEGDGLEIGGE